jgi:hypothetical protein
MYLTAAPTAHYYPLNPENPENVNYVLYFTNR